MHDIAVGIVGAGDRGLIRAATLVSSPGSSLSGVADPDASRAEALAERYRCSRFVSTPALLEASDVVCIATPTRDHFLIAREAVRRGRHVFLEWPPTTSIAEAQRVARLAEEADVLVGVSCPSLVHTEVADAHREGPSALVHLLWQYGTDSNDAVNWPHELAEALALGTWLARTRATVTLNAQAVRSTRPALRSVAFALRLQNGTYIQALLDHGSADGPTTKVLYLPGENGTRHVRLAGAPESDALADNAPGVLLDREFRRFLAVAKQGKSTSDGLFTITEAIPVMHLLERLLGKLR